MQRPDYLPDNYPAIQVADSMDEVIAAELGPQLPGVNCVLHPRRVSGDFNALAIYLDSQLLQNNRFCQVIAAAKRDMLAQAQILSTENCAMAAHRLLEDMDSVGRPDSPWKPAIRLVRADGYREKEDSRLVYSFHADSRRDLLSCYDRPTEYVRNEDAVRQPQGGERCYSPTREDVRIYRFGAGDVWTHAPHPQDSSDPHPFIHRAPKPRAGDPPRLLLHAVKKQP